MKRRKREAKRKKRAKAIKLKKAIIAAVCVVKAKGKCNEATRIYNETFTKGRYESLCRVCVLCHYSGVVVNHKKWSTDRATEFLEKNAKPEDMAWIYKFFMQE